MAVVVHVQPLPKTVTELSIGHLRAQVTFTPSVKLNDWHDVTIEPIDSGDEPSYYRYLGDIEGTIQGHTVNDRARAVVTAKRVVLCCFESFKPKGEVIVVSIDRDDLESVTEIPSRRRNKPGAASIIAPGVNLRYTPRAKGTETFVADLQAHAADQLGADALERDRAKKREAEKERLNEINEHAALAQAEAEAKRARAAGRPDLSFGMLDHRKTWHYSAVAPVDQCVQAFVAAFKGRGGLVLNGKWDIAQDNEGATAVYRGRRGLMGLASALAKTAQDEEESAVGTTVRFTAGQSPSGKALCTLRLEDRGKTFGLTSDARFIRPHFQAVTAQLKRLDPELEVQSN